MLLKTNFNDVLNLFLFKFSLETTLKNIVQSQRRKKIRYYNGVLNNRHVQGPSLILYSQISIPHKDQDHES